MRSMFYVLPLCLALLTSCAQPTAAATQKAAAGAPILEGLPALETVIYHDFDETWYVLREGDRSFSQVESALSQLSGMPCEDPDLTGCYDFSLTAGEDRHDLIFTSGRDESYACLDGQWYTVDDGSQRKLVELMLDKGATLPKEQWSHDPNYITLDVLLWNNSGLSSKAQTVCDEEPAPYAYNADISMEDLVQNGVLPRLTSYIGSYSLGYYREDGALFSYQAGWQAEGEQLTLTIWPKKPQDPEQTDGILIFEPGDLTKTELTDSHGRTVTVYGDGTLTTRVSRLIFTLPSDVYCQIEALQSVPSDDPVSILRCLIQSGFDPADYAQEPLPDSRAE